MQVAFENAKNGDCRWLMSDDDTFKIFTAKIALPPQGSRPRYKRSGVRLKCPQFCPRNFRAENGRLVEGVEAAPLFESLDERHEWMTIGIPWIELNDERSNMKAAASVNRFAWPSITTLQHFAVGLFHRTDVFALRKR